MRHNRETIHYGMVKVGKMMENNQCRVRGDFGYYNKVPLLSTMGGNNSGCSTDSDIYHFLHIVKQWSKTLRQSKHNTVPSQTFHIKPLLPSSLSPSSRAVWNLSREYWTFFNEHTLVLCILTQYETKVVLDNLIQSERGVGGADKAKKGTNCTFEIMVTAVQTEKKEISYFKIKDVQVLLEKNGNKMYRIK